MRNPPGGRKGTFGGAATEDVDPRSASVYSPLGSTGPPVGAHANELDWDASLLCISWWTVDPRFDGRWGRGRDASLSLSNSRGTGTWQRQKRRVLRMPSRLSSMGDWRTANIVRVR